MTAHETNNEYVIQVFDTMSATWKDLKKATLASGPSQLRGIARRSGKSVRLYNVTKKAAYVVCDPR